MSAMVKGLALLAAILAVQHGMRAHRPTPKQFDRMIGLEDCAVPYLDTGLLRRV